MVRKLLLVDRRKHLCYGLLNESVSDRWNSELPLSTIRLRYFHAPYRLWAVCPCPELFFDGFAVLRKVFSELRVIHSIHARGSFVTNDLQICLIKIVPGKYLLHETFHVHALFPFCPVRFDHPKGLSPADVVIFATVGTYFNLLTVRPFAPPCFHRLSSLLRPRLTSHSSLLLRLMIPSVRPPRIRCAFFPFICLPHLPCSYDWQLCGFVPFSGLTKRSLALYVVPVRQAKGLLTASFRFSSRRTPLLFSYVLPRYLGALGTFTR